MKENLKGILKSIKENKISFLLSTLICSFILSFMVIILSLINFDTTSIFSSYLEKQNISFIQIGKYQFEKGNIYSRSLMVLDEVSQDKIDLSFKSYPIYSWSNIPFRDIHQLLHITKLDIINDDKVSMYEFGDTISAEIVVLFDSKIIKDKIIGRYPENENEILISNYIADLIMMNGITTVENNLYKPLSYDELISDENTYYFGNMREVKIVGIIDYDLSDYQMFKKYDISDCNQLENICGTMIERKFKQLRGNVFGKIYVAEDFIESEKDLIFDDDTYRIDIIDNENIPNEILVIPLPVTNQIEYYNGTDWVTTNNLNDDEMIVNIHQIITDDKNFEKDFEQFKMGNCDIDEELCKKNFLSKYLEGKEIIGSTVTIYLQGKNDSTTETFKNVKIIGITNFKQGNLQEFFYLPDRVIESKLLSPFKLTGYLIPVENNNLISILSLFPYDEELSTSSIYSDEILISLDNLSMIKKVFPYFFFILFPVMSCMIISNCKKSLKLVKKESIKEIIIGRTAIMLLSIDIVSFLFLFFLKNKVNNFITSEFSYVYIGLQEILTLMILSIILFVFTVSVNVFIFKRRKVINKE